jgi:hypothetical protein
MSQQGTEALLKHLIHIERFTTSSADALYPRTLANEPVSGRAVELRICGGACPAYNAKMRYGMSIVRPSVCYHRR